MEIGHTFTINCTALGVPTPKIVWRLNWGHVPEKCTMKSIPECPQENDNHAYGEITCPDAKESDQGAYSCEAINIKGNLTRLCTIVEIFENFNPKILLTKIQ